jgi:hypothetical protein
MNGLPAVISMDTFAFKGYLFLRFTILLDVTLKTVDDRLIISVEHLSLNCVVSAIIKCNNLA